MEVDVARRFHYRVKAGSKEQVPLLPLTISYSSKCVSFVLVRPAVGGVFVDETIQLVHLNKDSIWLPR